MPMSFEVPPFMNDDSAQDRRAESGRGSDLDQARAVPAGVKRVPRVVFVCCFSALSSAEGCELDADPSVADWPPDPACHSFCESDMCGWESRLVADSGFGAGVEVDRWYVDWLDVLPEGESSDQGGGDPCQRPSASHDVQSTAVSP